MSTDELLEVAFRGLWEVGRQEGYDFRPWEGVSDELAAEFDVAYEQWCAKNELESGGLKEIG